MVKLTKAKITKDIKETFVEGLKYPWNNASRLWYALWLLVPIYGWLALLGYTKIITIEMVKGNRIELPKFGKSYKNFKEGAYIFFLLIPTIFALALINMIPLIGWIVAYLGYIFLLPWLAINFMVKGTFESLWEIEKAANIVLDNVKEYLLAFLKTLGYYFIYWALSFVIVGIPCNMFGKGYFLTEFYAKHC
jgi:hypothetical protein